MAIAAVPHTVNANGRRVLVIDDEPAVLRVLGLLLERHGFAVSSADNARDGLRLVEKNKFHAILTDIIMPELSGVDFLRELRRHDLDVPVILMTAGPTLDSAIEAIEYGAQQYLLKPVEPEALVQAVGRAAALGELARYKRDALAKASKEALPYGDRQTLEAVLNQAFGTIHVVFQPVVSMRAKKLIGYEALMRCDEALFASYNTLLTAADRIGWRTALERTIYKRIAAASTELPEGAVLFVNVHPNDAQEGLLMGAEAPLEPIARNVVLEVSEHAPVEQLDAMAGQIDRLRGAGFRIAVDDVGTGPSGLLAFTRLKPDFVKLDRTLLARLDEDESRLRMVRGMYALAREIGVPMIAEGVESTGERDALASLGADYAQGNFFGKPTATFAAPVV
jgi:EAL domain-containing protein (putative c-di-GMP-specific phosphodiesterase class I)/CheY-like chemotaxis protein